MRSLDLATVAYMVKKLGFDRETIEIVKKHYRGEEDLRDSLEFRALIEFLDEELKKISVIH